MIQLTLVEKNNHDKMENHPLFIHHCLLGKVVGKEIIICNNKYLASNMEGRVDENATVEIIKTSVKFKDFPFKGLDHAKIQSKIEKWEENGYKNCNLLITGKSGAGKSCLARHLPINIYTKVLHSSQILSDLHFLSIVKEAVEQKPSIIVIEDVEEIFHVKCMKESIYKSKEARIFQLFKGLFEQDGIKEFKNGIFMIGTSRFKEGLLFQEVLELKGTTFRARIEILNEIFRKIPGIQVSNELLTEIAHASHGYNGSDLQNLCRFVLIERKLQGLAPEVEFQYFKRGMTIVKPAGISEFAAKVCSRK